MSEINPSPLCHGSYEAEPAISLAETQAAQVPIPLRIQGVLSQVKRESELDFQPSGAVNMPEDRTFADLLQSPVAKGLNSNEAIFSSTISPMFSSFKAHFVKDPELHHLEIEKICDFLREVIPTYHEQLTLEQQHSSLNEQELLHVAMCEVLAKGLAYRDLDPKTHEIPIPAFTVKDRLGVAPYSVEIIPIEYGSGSIFAYGLVPPEGTDLPPILLFRGTTPYPSAETAKDTLITDTCPDGPGFDILFESSGISGIADWLVRHTRDGERKAWVTGHSLAGSMTQMVATHLPRFIDKAHAFNSPGVSEHTFDLWRELPEKPTLRVFNHPKDWVSLAGGFFVGETYVVQTDTELRWLVHAHKAHNILLFLQREWILFQVDHHEYSLVRPQRGVHSALRKLMNVGHPILKKWFHPDLDSEPNCTNNDA